MADQLRPSAEPFDRHQWTQDNRGFNVGSPMRDYQISEPMNELLLALSRGPVAEPPWEEFLCLLGEALSADFVTLILRAPREGDAGLVINSVVLSPAVYSAYNESYFALDPFV
ncbi:MAG: hypothetical protein RLP45_13320, partial [Haliea sp.]